jgi:SAM-dependent methyltransferase
MSSEAIRLLHSAEWRSSPPRQQIRRYFEAIGIPDGMTKEAALDRLEARFPNEWAAFVDSNSAVEGTERSALYACKNASLEFSLLVGVCGRGDFHRGIMRWLSEAKLQPKHVFDVGCDNGVLTCFFALLWPASSILGIDLSPEGVARAGELSAKLGISNVRFETCALDQFIAWKTGTTFDLILTTTFLQEAGYFPEAADRRFYDTAFEPRSAGLDTRIYKSVAGLLDPQGATWLGAEMLKAPDLYRHWIQSLEAVGLGIEPALTRRLKCGDEIATVLSATNRHHNPATIPWMKESWFMKPLPVWNPKRDSQSRLSGVEAQFKFESIPDKIRKAAAQIWPSGQQDHPVEAERIEIWTTATAIILYRAHLDMGVELAIKPLSEKDEVVGLWEAVAKTYADSGSRFKRWVDL